MLSDAVVETLEFASGSSYKQRTVSSGDTQAPRKGQPRPANPPEERSSRHRNPHLAFSVGPPQSTQKRPEPSAFHLFWRLEWETVLRLSQSWRRSQGNQTRSVITVSMNLRWLVSQLEGVSPAPSKPQHPSEAFPGSVDRALMQIAHTVGAVDLVLVADSACWMNIQRLPDCLPAFLIRQRPYSSHEMRRGSPCKCPPCMPLAKQPDFAHQFARRASRM